MHTYLHTYLWMMADEKTQVVRKWKGWTTQDRRECQDDREKGRFLGLTLRLFFGHDAMVCHVLSCHAVFCLWSATWENQRWMCVIARWGFIGGDGGFVSWGVSWRYCVCILTFTVLISLVWRAAKKKKKKKIIISVCLINVCMHVCMQFVSEERIRDLVKNMYGQMNLFKESRIPDTLSRQAFYLSSI